MRQTCRIDRDDRCKMYVDLCPTRSLCSRDDNVMRLRWSHFFSQASQLLSTDWKPKYIMANAWLSPDRKADWFRCSVRKFVEISYRGFILKKKKKKNILWIDRLENIMIVYCVSTPDWFLARQKLVSVMWGFLNEHLQMYSPDRWDLTCQIMCVVF